MAVIRQGGSNPNAGKMTTSTGIKEYSRRCMSCGLIKDDDIFTVNANGKAVCSDCATPANRRAFKTDCDDGVCTCADREPEDGRLEDASDPDE